VRGRYGGLVEVRGVYKGFLRKRLEIDVLQLLHITAPSGGEVRFWGLPESEMTRVWESWLLTTLPDRPEWTVAIRLEPDRRGEFVAAELRIFPTEDFDGDPDEDPRIRGEWSRALSAIPDGGIRVRDLRHLSLASHVRIGRKEAVAAVAAHIDELQSHAAHLGHTVEPKLQSWFDALPPPPAGPSGRGKRIPDLDYIRVAAIYIRHCEAESNRPAVDTANDLGGNWTSAKVREWLRRARQRGLMTPGLHGRSGGRLTEQAETILRTSTPLNDL
jgi:hypothetical protein